jgi:outer membrane protein assembly factor BamB
MLVSMNHLTGLLLFATGSAFALNWPEWRGPQRTGVTADTNLPIHWSTNENVRWRTALPARGNSTPIVWGNRVFITQAVEARSTGPSTSKAPREGSRRSVLCLDRGNGKVLWESGVKAAADEPTHQDNPYCSGSPATDGERVIAWFGSPGLYAYDLDGKALWHRDLGEQRHIWGNGSSPVIEGNWCFLNFGPGPRSFLIAVDKRSGKTVWQHDEPGGDSGEQQRGGAKPAWVGSWSTPIMVAGELIAALPSRVVAFDPATGKERWSCRGLNPLVYASPLYSDGILVAMGGFGGSSLAVKTGGQGDVTETHRLWQIPKNKQRIGSGVIHGDHIYILDDPGIAECIDLKTGKVVSEERLKGKSAATDNWSSMVASGDKLYAINKAGDAFVVRATPAFEVLGSNSLGERTLSSVAPSGNDLFIRTYQALWCISAKP